jgi:hypothetical protein
MTQYKKVMGLTKNKRLLTPASYEQLLLLTCLGLYTMMPPRRSQDYTELKYTNKEIPSDTIGDENILSLKNWEMTIGKYKTKQHLGVYQTVIPTKLRKIITLYLKYRPDDGSDYLLIYNNTPFVQNTMTNLLAKMDLGINILRHSFITHNLKENTDKNIILANAMGHSTAEQSAYIKNYD